jgi:hypothetical protein
MAAPSLTLAPASELGDQEREQEPGSCGERRDSATLPSDIAVEQLVCDHEGGCTAKKPHRRKPRAAALERLLEKVEGKRRDERAAASKGLGGLQ